MLAKLVGGLTLSTHCCRLISLAGFKNEEPHYYSVKSVTFVLAALKRAGNVHVSTQFGHLWNFMSQC